MAEKLFQGEDPTISAIHRVIETLGNTTVQITPGERDRTEEPQIRASMESTRPEWLKAAIDSDFGNIVQATKDYGYHGMRGDYSFGGKSAVELIADYRKKRGDPLRVLDVGTGVGAFLTTNSWPSGDVVHGISGFDYRTNPLITWPDVSARFYIPAKDDTRYLIGNAEYLNEIEGVLPLYDVIVSKRVLQHFVDPLGSLEAIANRVAPNGMLCLHAGRTNHKRATSLLLQHGFRLMEGLEDIADLDDPKSYRGGTVLIRVDDQPIRFGLKYEHKGPGYIEELDRSSEWPLTTHEINTLSWQYVGLS